MTAEQLCALPDADRVDRRLIRGILIERPSPYRSPAHAGVLPNLYRLFGNWEKTHGRGRWSVYGYGCPYRLHRDPDTLVHFDLSVIPAELKRATARFAHFMDGLPVFVAEVVDLNDTPEQVGELLGVALESGIPLVWMIDPFTESVDVHHRGGQRQILTPDHEITADPVLPGFRCRVAEIFE